MYMSIKFCCMTFSLILPREQANAVPWAELAWKITLMRLLAAMSLARESMLISTGQMNHFLVKKKRQACGQETKPKEPRICSNL